MALHRDIHWIGRQWAVTGFGMQVIDQKRAGAFDIETARLWDDGLLETLREQKWFNADDFAKALAIARRRYPEPPRKSAPSPPVETLLQASGVIEPPQESPAIETPTIPPANPVEPKEPPPSFFKMHTSGRARFMRAWHIRFK